MSHHSENYDGEMDSKFATAYKEMLSKAGATGRFPDGKLTKRDEGEIAIVVATVDNAVVIEFGKSVHWLGMTGNEAIILGRALIKRGRKLNKNAEGGSKL